MCTKEIGHCEDCARKAELTLVEVRDFTDSLVCIERICDECIQGWIDDNYFVIEYK